MTSIPLSNIDTVWLRMEEPTNLMVINGVMIFASRLTVKQLAAVIEHRLLCFDRFRQRIVPSPDCPDAYNWEDDPVFNLDYHLQRFTQPMKSGQAKLQALVSQLMGTPLDFSHPLWQVHLVEKYGRGSALIWRLHHSIADGAALVQILLSLTDESPTPSVPSQPMKSSSPIPPTIPGLREAGSEILSDPARLGDLAKLGLSGASALGRLLLRIPDPPTIFKGPLGIHKRVAWSPPLPLEEVKAIGYATGSTVNDVLIAAMTGALRQYLESRQQELAGLEIRAVIPVNLRPLDAYTDLGNHFGLVFLSLPVGVADPLKRLAEVKSTMDEIKGTPEAVVAFGIINLVGSAPPEIQNLAVDLLQTKGTTVMTNVAGPHTPRYLAGALLDTLLFWVPQAGRLGLGVSIISYNGRVWLGVVTDKGLIPDPEIITSAFEQEFTRLQSLACQMEPLTVRGQVQRMKRQLDQALLDLEGLENG